MVRTDMTVDDGKVGLMRRITLAVVLGLLFTTSGISREEDRANIQLKLRDLGTEHRIGQPLLAQLSVVSDGHQSVWIPNVMLLGANVSVEMRNASNQRIPYLGVKSQLKPFGKEDFMRLSPGYFYGMEIDLAKAFDCERPGKYVVRAWFENEDDGHNWGYRAWTGSITTQDVEIHIEGRLSAGGR